VSWDSSVGIATYYGLDGPGIESQVGVRFSALVPTGSAVYPTPYTMGIRSFTRVKLSRCGIDQPTPSSAKAKERVELYRMSPPWPSWPVLDRTSPAEERVVLTCANNASFDQHPSVPYVNCSYQIRC
jgi:hypothetical protein